MEKGHLLYTVDNALAECLNVIWKHATLLRDLSVGDTKTAIHYLLLMFNRLNVAKTPDIAEQTMAIAQTLKVPVYDALYIALAEKEKATIFELEGRETLSKLYAKMGKYELAYLEYKKFRGKKYSHYVDFDGEEDYEEFNEYE